MQHTSTKGATLANPRGDGGDSARGLIQKVAEENTRRTRQREREREWKEREREREKKKERERERERERESER